MYTYTGTVTNVVDGDTFDATIDLGFYVQMASIRFRLQGVNTPEIFGANATPQGHVAKAFVVDAFARAGNRIVIKSTKSFRGDKYGRWLAEVFVGTDEKSLNQQLLEAGLAIPYV